MYKINKKRALTLNKSFLLSFIFHAFLIFGVTFTTIIISPYFDNSKIINVKLANANIDEISFKSNSLNNFSDNFLGKTSGNALIKKNTFSQKIKRLESNSINSDAESIYLNLWQRKIETTGDKLILESGKRLDSKLQILATINSEGNLVSAEILISSGNKDIDMMALNILKQSSPFEAFSDDMKKEYTQLEIVREWNFIGQ